MVKKVPTQIRNPRENKYKKSEEKERKINIILKITFLKSQTKRKEKKND